MPSPVPVVVDDAAAEAMLAECGAEFGGHVKKVIKALIQSDPEQAFKVFEVLSRKVKEDTYKNGFSYDAVLSEEELAAKLHTAATRPKFIADPAGEDGGLLGVAAGVENFVEQSKEVYNLCGVGFSEGETLAVMNGLRHFGAAQEGIEKLRLWGKVLGAGGDYYVVETRFSGAGDESDDPLFEALGSGANTYAYFVASDIYNPVWTKLPEVQPKYLAAAKDLKVVLTGDLEAKVTTYPFFAGAEKDLLRAVIARITSDTVINVKGMLTEGEDGSVAETPAEEWSFPAFEALASAGAWCHCTPYVLPSTGRCAYPEYDPENEETKVQFEAQEILKASEPAQSVLRDIATKDWAVRRHSIGGVGNAAVSVKSVKWPGAICCIKKGTKSFTNLYVGMGHCRDVDAFNGFYPSAPPAVCDESAVSTVEQAGFVAKPAEE